MNSHLSQTLAAPCGLYCGACYIYIARKRGGEVALRKIVRRLPERKDQVIKPREDLICDGCLSSQLSVFCRRCVIRECAFNSGITHCAQCSDFPCETITDFNNDGRPHHGEVLKNIYRQQKVGIDAWLSEQDKRWRCPNCEFRTEWYETKCPECAAKLSLLTAERIERMESH